MRIQYLALAVVLALVVVLGTLSPALGGSTSSDDAATAKKIAKRALRIANKALKAAKVPGPPGAVGAQGPAGAAGAAGAAGSALAYAKVSAAGAVDPAMSKGIASADVSHPQLGLYCFDLAFTPANVVATISDGAGGEISAFLPPSIGPACGEDDSAEVIAATSAGAGAERQFFIVFN